MRVALIPGASVIRQQGVVYLVWAPASYDDGIDITSTTLGNVCFIAMNGHKNYPYRWVQDLFLGI
jgi:hypothetical protein